MPNPFAEVKVEGQSVQAEIDPKVESSTADKPAAESQAETKEKVVEPSQGGEPKTEKSKDNTPTEDNLPFSKHPRFKSLLNTVDTLEKRLAEYEKAKETKPEPTGEQDVKLPDWWKDYYGDNDQSKTFYKNYLAQSKAQQEEIAEQIEKRFEEKQNAQAKAAEDANKFLDTEVDRLKADGRKFEKNELFKFMLDFEEQYGVSLTDAKGNYNLEKGLDLMEKLGSGKTTTSTDTKKKIASETMRSRGNASPNDSAIPKIDRAALSKRGSWRDFVKP